MAADLSLIPSVIGLALLFIGVPCVFTPLAWVLRRSAGKTGLAAGWLGASAALTAIMELRIVLLRRSLALTVSRHIVFWELGYFAFFSLVSLGGAAVVLGRRARKNPDEPLHRTHFLRGVLGFAAGCAVGGAVLLLRDLLVFLT